MLEAVVALALLGALGYIEVQRRDHARQRQEWRDERSRLLDRVMSRDYETFRAYTPEPRPNLKPVLNDLEEAKFEAGESLDDLSERDRAFIEEIRSGR